MDAQAHCLSINPNGRLVEFDSLHEFRSVQALLWQANNMFYFRIGKTRVSGFFMHMLHFVSQGLDLARGSNWNSGNPVGLDMFCPTEPDGSPTLNAILDPSRNFCVDDLDESTVHPFFICKYQGIKLRVRGLFFSLTPKPPFFHLQRMLSPKPSWSGHVIYGNYFRFSKPKVNTSGCEKPVYLHPY